VVTELKDIVKELVENSIDAGANTIEVRLVNGGLDSIEVKDNGAGINVDDRVSIGKRYYTSKLKTFEVPHMCAQSM
jgi:DNA mismatch repair protein PMS2